MELQKMKEKTETHSKKLKNPMAAMPYKQKANLKRSKRVKQVLVLYLDIKGNLSFRLVPIFAGDIIVLNDKAHRIEPQHLLTFGKYKAYLVRETDKRIWPISNADYDSIVQWKNSTSTHPTLIKALLSATTEMKKKKPVNWVPIAIVAAIVIIGIIAFV